MPDFEPVDHDPFASQQDTQLVPVDYNPFASKYYLASHGIETVTPSDTQPKPIEQVSNEAKDYREKLYKGLLTEGTYNKLFGEGGEERYQLFPEKIVRSIGNLMNDPAVQVTDKGVSDQKLSDAGMEGLLNAAGLAGGAPFAIKPGTASLGSGLIRPMVKMNTNEAPVFYSAVENAVNGITQPKMTGQQWLGTIANKPGVKPEEMDFTGLKGFLEENGNKPVTKQEVQNFINENKVQVNEVNLGGPKAYEVRPDDIALAKYGKEWDALVNEKRSLDKKSSEGTLTDSENSRLNDIVNKLDVLHAQSIRETLQRNPVNNPTKYQSYQLPGSEGNYREKLFTLPDKPDPNKIRLGEINKRLDEIQDDFNSIRDRMDKGELDNVDLLNYRKNLSDEQKTLVKEFQERANPNRLPDNQQYKSSHWDEPNVLAHVRMNDRVIPSEGFAVQNVKSGNKRSFDTQAEAEAFQKTLPTSIETKIIPSVIPKKSLHLEEIQSDWHQAGRDKGYDDPIARKAAEDKLEKAGYPISGEDARMAARDGVLTEEEARTIGNRSYIPDAPFKKTWPDLVIKRMVREAAENGYDKLSWTPGEAQAARYDLSKQVEAIRAIKRNDGNYTLSYRQKNQPDIGENSYQSMHDVPVPENKLADFVGKDLAEKIIKQGGGKFEGVDLKVGGEGMKGFYDQIIPKLVEKITGEKVKTAEVNVPGLRFEDGSYSQGVKKKQKVHYIDIPQKLKDTAMQKGFPLFSGAGHMLTPVDNDPFNNENK